MIDEDVRRFDRLENAADCRRTPAPSIKDDIARLASCVAEGDAATLRQLMRSISDALCEPTLSVAVIRSACFDINASLLGARRRVNQDVAFLSDTALLRQLFAIRGAEDARSYLQALEHNVLREMHGGEASPSIEKIIDYIHEQCLSPDFSLNEAAEHFGLLPSALSRFFKTNCGVPPSQYIMGLRIEAAKKALAATNLPLNDIVAQVGYYSNSSFIKAFREYEGITPGQYRRLCQTHHGTEETDHDNAVHGAT